MQESTMSKRKKRTEKRTSMKTSYLMSITLRTDKHLRNSKMSQLDLDE